MLTVMCDIQDTSLRATGQLCIRNHWVLQSPGATELGRYGARVLRSPGATEPGRYRARMLQSQDATELGCYRARTKLLCFEGWLEKMLATLIFY